MRKRIGKILLWFIRSVEPPGREEKETVTKSITGEIINEWLNGERDDG